MPDPTKTNLQEALEGAGEWLTKGPADLTAFPKLDEEHALDLQENFESFQQTLNALNEQLGKLMKLNSRGIYENVTPEQFTELMALYNKAAGQASAYLNTAVAAVESLSDQAEKKRLKEALTPAQDITKKLGKVLAADMRAFGSYEPEKNPASLFDLLEKARTHTVEVGETTLDHVGGALSSRIPLTFRDAGGTVHTGFFTKKTYQSYRTLYENVFREAGEVDPAVKAALDALPDYFKKTTPNNLSESEVYQNCTEQEKKEFLITWALSGCKRGEDKRLDPQRLSNLLQNVSRDLNPNRRVNPEAFQMAADILCQKLSPGFYPTHMNQINGIMEHERIDSRNTAMSAVADLLGKPQLLARSTSMKLVYNGEEIEGTFMEKAVGNRYGEFPSEIKEASFFRSQGTVDMADLQVIDFICGNTDRHMGNMTYDFKWDPAEKRFTFSGVQGIDNDLSFGGLTLPRRDKGGNKLVGFNQMRVMSKDMADRVLKLTPDALSFRLQGLELSERAIRNTCERLKNLQGFIREELKHYERLEAEKKQLEEKAAGTGLSGMERARQSELKDILENRTLEQDHVRIMSGEEIRKLDPQQLDPTLPHLKPDEKDVVKVDEPLPPREEKQGEELSAPKAKSAGHRIFSFLKNIKNVFVWNNRRQTKKIEYAQIKSGSRVSAEAVDVYVNQASQFRSTLRSVIGKDPTGANKEFLDRMNVFVKSMEDSKGNVMDLTSVMSRNAYLKYIDRFAGGLQQQRTQELEAAGKTKGAEGKTLREKLTRDINALNDLRDTCRKGVFMPNAKEEKEIRAFEQKRLVSFNKAMLHKEEKINRQTEKPSSSKGKSFGK